MVLMDNRQRKVYVGDEAARILLASIRHDIGYWGSLEALAPSMEQGADPMDAKRSLEQVLLEAWELTAQ